MDIDENDIPPHNGVDIEQSLLQQFSCMGTTDKDELVQQLQKLLGNQLNHSTASFFLDMNNWNLQAAICSYFDFENPIKLPSMALASDPKATESENVEANTSFQKTWSVYNNGNDPWPVGCVLQCANGHDFNGGKMPVPCLQPGEGTILSLTLTSPAMPGMYQSMWRLCTSSGSYFGDTLWVIVTVIEAGTTELTQQLSHFSDLGSSPPHNQTALNPFLQQRSHTVHLPDGTQKTEDGDSNMC